MQAEGNWAGGCQQTYGMAMIDINFGPDSSEWYCVSAENLNKFHSVFKAGMKYISLRVWDQC